MTNETNEATPAASENVTVQRHEHKSLDYQDSIEMPSGGTKDRTPGWKMYCDFLESDKTKARIEAAKFWAAYAYEYAPPPPGVTPIWPPKEKTAEPPKKAEDPTELTPAKVVA
jgi:hypothetical protein